MTTPCKISVAAAKRFTVETVFLDELASHAKYCGRGEISPLVHFVGNLHVVVEGNHAGAVHLKSIRRGLGFEVNVDGVDEIGLGGEVIKERKGLIENVAVHAPARKYLPKKGPRQHAADRIGVKRIHKRVRFCIVAEENFSYRGRAVFDLIGSP